MPFASPGESLIERLGDDSFKRRVETLLADQRFEIEYPPYFTNHAKHAVIALAGLGAGKERVVGYYDWYVKRVQLRAPDDPKAEPITSWTKLLGKRERFAGLCSFFEAEAALLGGALEVVRAYASELLPGMPGALTHGIIHLGWAIDAGSRPMTIEGLAYLTFSHLPVDAGRFVLRAHADPTPLDSLLRSAFVWAEENGRAWAARISHDPRYSAARGFHPELTSTFSRSVAALLTEGHPLIYELPAWLETTAIGEVLRQLYEAVATLYLSSAGEEAGKGTGRAPGAPGAGPGSFVRLHLVTSLWGVEHVIAMLPTEQEQRQALRCYWATLVAVTAATKVGLPNADDLAGTLARFPLPERETATAAPSAAGTSPAWARSTVDDGGSATDKAWGEVKSAAMQEEEEHNQKLVYVAYELRGRYGDGWAGWLAMANTFTSS